MTETTIYRAYTLRRPRPEDAHAVHRLIARCPPLDGNSLYCNLLQCTHFADTCTIALDADDEPAGFVSAYRPPTAPETLFVWQIAVDGRHRGQGLAAELVLNVLRRPAARGVRYLECTITPDNAASWALFDAIAGRLGGECRRTPFFDRDRHFRGSHASEDLVHIGPFTRIP
ncbi:MAG: L-2,4-diaminobutyric acid acetyltransferase [Gammaproteobacteria bacterium]|nr:MAG: L-2,4-diaminobutyric acid acetyltransferase [Gammaproteobacteria bacterium]